jgi:hypothetical protein
LRLEPGNVGRIVRSHEPVNERAGAGQLCIAIDQDQVCIHHTVSAQRKFESAFRALATRLDPPMQRRLIENTMALQCRFVLFVRAMILSLVSAR